MTYKNLTTIENMTIEFCGAVQKYCNNIDLSYTTIQDDSKILVQLYRVERDLDLLQKLNKTHEVVNNGKVLGELFDNDFIGGVMLSTRMVVAGNIQACEDDIRYLTKKLII